MKTSAWKWLVASALMAPLLWGQAHGAGLMKAKGAEGTGLRIVEHHVNVVINNGFAKTEVDQTFANDTDADIEGLYTFPLPKQSSLSEVSLWINGQETIGEVLEKAQARKVYEDQLAKGNETALAEKNDFKTYDVRLGRIKAGMTSRVRLVYYQPVDIDLNVGRYLYPLAEGNVDDARIPFWSVDDKVDGPFTFDLELKSAFPVKDVRLPGFEAAAAVTRQTNAAESANGDVYRVALHSAEASALNRDIVLYYRLDDSAPARVELVPYRADANKEGTLMVVVTPAADLKRIAEGTDWMFVLDKSGSMAGQKIAALADGVARSLGKMSPNDRFRIITFDSGARDMTGGYVAATPENVQSWITRVKALQGDGSTALFAGLELAYRALDADRTAAIILVTDGVCNVGPTEHAAFLKLLRQYDIRLFTFVIGNSANQPLMDRLAEDSGGFAMNLSDSDDIYGRLVQAKAKILYECMHDVRLTFRGEKVHDLTPAKVGNLYQGQQLVMFGKFSGSGPVELELRARISGEDKTWTCTATLPDQDVRNPEIERLWALSAIDDRMKEIRENGESEALRKSVAGLGTAYSLVTDYTSMVVVRDDVAEAHGIQRVNADRVARERQAQAVRAAAPVQNYRVDNGGTFRGGRAANVGSGPVGPLFVIGAAWLALRRRKAA